jgi:hypothetical protein
MTPLPILVLLLGAYASAASTQPAPEHDGAESPEGAIACAAARYRGEVLSVRWKPRERLWELRWLTPARNVLRIEIAPPDCRFRRVDGVGQKEARIAP